MEKKAKKGEEMNEKVSMNWFCALTMRIKTSHSLQ